MKQCSKCGNTQPTSEFYKNKARKDGFTTRCKICSDIASRKWELDNKEKNRARVLKWIKENPEKDAAKSARRRAEKAQRMLKWGKEMHKTEIDNWYRRANLAEHFMGGKWHVDHIVPLKGKTVSGLHVPWNLQILPALENMKKGNKHVETNTTTPVSARDHQQGEVYPELGPFSATGTWQDDDDPHHHCGADARQDADHRAQTSSGDSVAHRNKKVEPSRAFTRSQDNGEPEPEISRTELRGGRLFD